MSGGANKRFRKGMLGEWIPCSNGDPDAYLRQHIFYTQPDNSLPTTNSGLMRFNLREVGNRLTLQRIQPGCCSIGPNDFNAYFCANVQGRSESVLLGNDANYFFTPALTQCILEINGLRVTHHDAQAPVFPPAHLAALPRGGGAGQRTWDSGAYYASTVVGRRLGSNRWEFWHQSVNLVLVMPLGAAQVGAI